MAIENKSEPTVTEHSCFMCGKDNPIGFKLKFTLDKEKKSAMSETIVRKEFNGFTGVVHGGIIAAMLDETSFYAITNCNVVAVTASLNIKYKRPVPVETKLILKANVVRERKKLIETTASIELEDGTILATSEATFFVTGTFREDLNQFLSLKN